jgi:hypothetical protein
VNTGLRQRLAKLEELQDFLPTHPYSVVLRLRLAKAYKDLGYPDLALGDAYKALLLVDELGEEGEFCEQALSAATVDFASSRAAKFARASSEWFEGLDFTRCSCLTTNVANIESREESDGNESLTRAKECWSQIAYAPSTLHFVACSFPNCRQKLNWTDMLSLWDA